MTFKQPRGLRCGRGGRGGGAAGQRTIWVKEPRRPAVCSGGEQRIVQHMHALDPRAHSHTCACKKNSRSSARGRGAGRGRGRLTAMGFAPAASLLLVQYLRRGQGELGARRMVMVMAQQPSRTHATRGNAPQITTGPAGSTAALTAPARSPWRAPSLPWCRCRCRLHRWGNGERRGAVSRRAAGGGLS